MSKKILIATDVQFLNPNRGSSRRIKSYYDFLVRRHNVDVLFFTKDKITRKNVFNYADFLPEERKPIKIEQPYNISSQVKYEYKLAFDNFVSKNNYDFIIIPYIWLSYLLDEKPETSAKFIIDTHDIFSKRTHDFEKIGQKFTSACSVEEEKFCLRNYDSIIAISNNDKKHVENMGYRNVLTAKYHSKIQSNKIKLGIIGGYSAHNVDSVWWFCENILKNIADDRYVLYVCGDIARHEHIKPRYKNSDRIFLYEYIWNVEDFYSMIDIAINPCRIGSGLKIKNIEAISFCKPLITSSNGAEGMEEEVALGLVEIADNIDEWEAALSKLSDKNYIQSIKKAQQDYNSKHTPEFIYNDLLKLLES